MTASGKRTLALSLLIGLATMPDAIVPIALKSAVVDRWHVSMSMATWFAAASLLGAVLVLPMLRVLDRRFSPGWTIAWASILNAIVLAVMSASIDLGTAMVLRVIAGGMDMVTLAVLLGLLERGDPDRSGHRFGPASMAIMVGLAVGFGFGGMLAKELGGQIFLVGAAFSVLLAVAAGGTGGLLKGEAAQRQPRTRSVRYWPTLAFGFADRAIGAIVTVPVTLFLISDADIGEQIVGSAMAGVLLIIAMGSWPAGILIDRVGPLPIRIGAVFGYALGFAAIATAPWVPVWVVLVCLGVMGMFGAGLSPSMYVLAARRSGGSVDMGGVQAAGAAGYLTGAVVGGLVLAWHESSGAAGGFQILLLGGATMYLLINLPAIAAMAGWRVRGRLSGT
jgi:MFS family permease